MQKKIIENKGKAVIYARYSSDRQREESIEGQLRVCEDFAKRNGMTILHVYADRALSGRSDQRPEFQMMIQPRLHKPLTLSSSTSSIASPETAMTAQSTSIS